MTIEAIGAVSSAAQKVSSAAEMAQAQSPAPSGASGVQESGAVEISMRASAPSQAQADSFTSKIGTQVYDTIDQLGVRLPEIANSSETALNQARKQIAPENSALSANPEASKPTGNESLVALSKTFDHAVFMAMVNQVISGVSDSARTLIRQT